MLKLRYEENNWYNRWYRYWKIQSERFLKSHGYEVIDADLVVRELQAIGGRLYLAIYDTFGQTFFLENGELDRVKLGDAIFSDEKMKENYPSFKIKLSVRSF